MNDPKEKSGFEDDSELPWQKDCLHPEHQPPSHMVIPPGKVYRHVCPACGRRSVIRPNGTRMSV